MLCYKIGAMGDEVKAVQQRLKELGLYAGPLDGVFGGGTDSCVRAFQRSREIEEDGVVGENTWALLFPGQAPISPPKIAEKSLDMRCLALTGSFETCLPVPDCFAGLSGDFDGQGISFGALQWNLGQGSLQPMLTDMNTRYPEILRNIFGTHYQEFVSVLAATKAEQIEWAKSIQNGRHQLAEPWMGMLKTLGRQAEFQEIELSGARDCYQSALRWCDAYGLKSERAVALMFDIRVQNGSINDTVKSQIARDFQSIEEGNEEARLVAVANRRAEAASRAWVEDVRTRKLAIARGRGQVHGRSYDLEAQYGIGLRPAV